MAPPLPQQGRQQRESREQPPRRGLRPLPPSGPRSTPAWSHRPGPTATGWSASQNQRWRSAPSVPSLQCRPGLHSVARMQPQVRAPVPPRLRARSTRSTRAQGPVSTRAQLPVSIRTPVSPRALPVPSSTSWQQRRTERSAPSKSVLPAASGPARPARRGRVPPPARSTYRLRQAARSPALQQAGSSGLHPQVRLLPAATVRFPLARSAPAVQAAPG